MARIYDCAIQLQRAIEWAHKNNGICLSDKYIKAKDKLWWQCQYKHTWDANFDNTVNKGKWCPYCAGKAPLTIDFIKEFARNKNGECLIDTFITGRDVVQWKCENGHCWPARIQHVINDGSWCPECRNSISENICRRVFEIVFGVPFTKCRPSWLIGVRNYPLELDGFNEKIMMAFEYQGPQHYSDIYHNPNRFIINQENDNIKRSICKQRNITLIEVSHPRNRNSIDAMVRHIVGVIQDHGHTISQQIQLSYKDV